MPCTSRWNLKFYDTKKRDEQFYDFVEIFYKFVINRNWYTKGIKEKKFARIVP